MSNRRIIYLAAGFGLSLAVLVCSASVALADPVQQGATRFAPHITQTAEVSR